MWYPLEEPCPFIETRVKKFCKRCGRALVKTVTDRYFDEYTGEERAITAMRCPRHASHALLDSLGGF